MPSSSSTSRRATTASSWTTMPTKPSSQSRPSASTGRQAWAAIATAISSVTTRPRAPLNSFSARNSVAISRRAATCVGAARGEERKARRASAARAHRGSRAARAYGRAASAATSRSRRAPLASRSRGAMRTKPLALQRRISARGCAAAVELPVAQHVAHGTRREVVARRRVGVAMDQRRRLGAAHPGERGVGIDVDEAAVLARLAPAAASPAARRRWRAGRRRAGRRTRAAAPACARRAR